MAEEKIMAEWVIPGVLAASAVPTGLDQLHQILDMGIRSIVSATLLPLTSIQGIPPDFLQRLDVRYLHLPIREFSGPSADQTRRFIDFTFRMEKEKRPLLVHCRKGIGRTGTLLHLFFLSRGFSFEETKHTLLDRRPQCLLLNQRQTSAVLDYIESSKMLSYLHWKREFDLYSI
jgi:hypothetical protein